MTTLSVIPRYYWESKTKADPHFREDDGVECEDGVGSEDDDPFHHSQILLGI